MTLKLKSNNKGKLSPEQVKALFLKGSATCRCPFKKRCSESLQRKGRLFEGNEKGLHSFKGIFPPMFLCLQRLWLSLQTFLVRLPRDPSLQDKALVPSSWCRSKFNTTGLVHSSQAKRTLPALFQDFGTLVAESHGYCSCSGAVLA